MPDISEVTAILRRVVEGDREAVNDLFPLVYSQLRKIARNQLRAERKDHTLNATALVHEVFIRLVDQDRVDWQNRVHFFAVTATAMRRILVDYARGRNAEKRGGGEVFITLNEECISGEARAEQLVDLDSALSRLARMNERQSRIVELRFFAGLKEEEIAEGLGISVATVKRDWRLARAWLARELGSIREQLI
jgi:RNA polymerase sigma factor (TIGR02999 family)